MRRALAATMHYDTAALACLPQKQDPPLNDDRPRGIALLIAATFCLACMDAVSKYLATRYAVPQILAIRFAIFTVFALLIARPISLRHAFATHHPILQVVRSLVLVLEVSVFVVAFRYLPLADVHAIAGISPLLVTALAVVVLRESVGLVQWLAVGAGFIGLLLIVRPGIIALDPHLGWPLAGASLWAVYQILMRKVSRDPASTSLLYIAVAGLITTGALAPAVWMPPSGVDWIALTGLGLFGSLGHYLMIKALQAAPASVLQPYNYTLLIWAAALGFVFYGALPDGWVIAGAVVIAVAGIIAARHARAD